MPIARRSSAAQTASRIATLTALALIARPAIAAEPDPVLQTYAAIAVAGYEDSLSTARALQSAIDALIAAPSEATLAAARDAWRSARPPYQQTEAFRFVNPVVDDWEGRVNAWPLDEGLIDYVDPGYADTEGENDYRMLNVIANPKITIAGEEIDATEITPDLIATTLHEADGTDANVASGYHAIEFLLWGQDLHGTEAGAGERPHTDYLQGDGCTGGNCDRRAAYLKASADLLVGDLEEMLGNWQEGGAARAHLMQDGSVADILTGMGSLSYGELAGERMKLGLMLGDPEEEHDCFSDNTPVSHYYDAVGMRNVYTGSYTRLDGRVVYGPSVSALVAAKAPEVDAQLRSDLDASVAALGAIRSASDNGFAYDMMLASGSAEGEALIMGGVDALIAQTRTIGRALNVLGVGAPEFEGSDSLDDPSKVIQ